MKHIKEIIKDIVDANIWIVSISIALILIVPYLISRIVEFVIKKNYEAGSEIFNEELEEYDKEEKSI